MARTAQIGNLAVNLSANSASFSRDMDKARRSVTSNTARMNRALAKTEQRFVGMGKSLGRSVKNMMSFKAAIGVVAGSAGLGLLVKRTLDHADAIGKAADNIGIGVETLQEYRYAAELSGVAQQRLDKGLEAFVKRLGEAKQGTGALNTFLKKYDESLFNAVTSSKSTSEALNLITEEAGKMSSQMDRAALFAAAFSRTAGVQMTNMVKNGAQGLKEMRQEAQETGIVLRESLIRQAELTNDKLNLMGKIIWTQVSRAIISLTPSIVALGRAMAEAAPKITKFIQSLLPAEFATANELTRRIQDLKAQVKDMKESYSDVMGMGPGIGVGEKAVAKNPRVQALERQITQLERLREEARASEKQVDLMVNSLQKLDKKAQTRDSRSGSSKFFNQQLQGQGALSSTFGQSIGGDGTTFQAEFMAAQQAAQKYAESQRQIEGVYRSSLSRRQSALESYARSAQDTHRQVGNFAVNQIYSIEDALVRTAQTGKFEWKSMVNSMIADLMRMTFRKGSASLISDLAGGISGVLSSNTWTGSPGGSGYIGKAAGGPVSSGQTYIVGEKGPELLHMGSKGGHITPNHEIGGGGMNIENIHIHAVDARSFQELVNRNPGAIASALKQAMRAGDRELNSMMGSG
jgi:phage-related minor tail protein